MHLLPYKLVGRPRRDRNGHGQLARHFSQRYRLLSEKLVRSVSLKTADKGVATQRAVEFVENKIRQLAMKTDPVARTTHSTIQVALDEYINDLKAKGNSPKQAKVVKARITSIIEKAAITEYSEIDSVVITRAISDLWHTGAFKTTTTANRYREAMRAWTRWMKRNGRWETNLLEEMEKLKGDSTNSRPRERLTEDQLDKLIASTLNGPMRRNLFGPERAWLYLIASQTGLRASELASLSPNSFHLDAEPPYVEVHSTVSKRRRTDRVELRIEFAQLLGEWLKDKPYGERIWGRSKGWQNKAATMLRDDLKAAGLPTTVQSDEGEAVIDFHSFRGYRVTQAMLTGLPSSIVMKTVRLSSEALLKRYTKIHRSETSECVNAIPLPKSAALKS